MYLLNKLLISTKFGFYCFLIALTSFFSLVLSSAAHPIIVVDFLGQALLPTSLLFQGTELGGLSGITYDANKQVYYAISDDRSEKAPARFYTLKINLNQDLLKNDSVVPIGVTTLLDENNQPFSKNKIDSEGIALTDQESIFVSSEGNADKLINPFIKEFSLLTGQEIKNLTIPENLLPDGNRKRGIHNNLALEGLTITPNKKYLFTATENALIQDGTVAKSETSSPCRILQYNLFTNQLEHEYLYSTEPVKALLNIPGIFSNGIPDLLAVDNQGHFLSIERSFNGLKFNIRLFEISLAGADDIRDIDSLSAVDIKTIKPVKKQLLLNLNTLKNITLDNIEGLTFGPQLADGRQLLILVSDNNFRLAQRTQILAFAVRFK